MMGHKNRTACLHGQSMKYWIGNRHWGVAVALAVASFSFSINVCVGQEKEIPVASVGARGMVEGAILPGSELIAKPIQGAAPMVVQIVNTFRHGDGFRYDIRFSGLEPGKYDLSDWLVRKDGSEVGELPRVPVEITSLLPPGQIEPNQLETGWLPSLGGYRRVFEVAVGLWVLGLLAMIFLGRKKKVELAAESVPQKTFADLLHERLQAGLDNKIAPQQYAELERMLLTYWRGKLGYESLTTAESLQKIKAHSEAGPLILHLEQWMHRPDGNREVDLAGLLKPYRDMPADEMQLPSQRVTEAKP